MLLLHLPIGALCAIWFVELLLENKGDKHKNPTMALLQVLLLLTSILTLVLGIAYAAGGDYGSEIDAHARWGYLFSGGVGISHICYWIHYKQGRPGTHLIYIFALLATTLAMLATGHHGGELIHGKGFLTKAFKPAPAREQHPAAAAPSATATAQPAAQAARRSGPIAPQRSEPTAAPMPRPSSGSAAPAPQQAPTPSTPEAGDPHTALFENAQAVFNRHCTKCHGPSKQKGNYRLDHKHAIQLGGKSQRAAIVPGQPDQSELLRRMRLPRSDDEVMPPNSKAPVAAADIDAVRQWIAAGADWPEASEVAHAQSTAPKIGDANTDQWIEQINRTGAKAEYNAWGDHSVRVDLGVVDVGQLPNALQQLQACRHHLSWIDASHLTLPADFFVTLPHFPKLERLHLDGSNVSDRDLATLRQLPNLHYLNLYNTQVSDRGLNQLQTCPSLQRLYLGQTKVTKAGIQKLQRAHPELQIIHR